ncbi:hypothetical protein [Pseudonocardia sp. N23]|uniref:hypothetical protein n=1 Tax=Pseudonocardia sp. N23 TaxID=1987376 RepID=UPI000BFC2230|nr:hypothetical protein [Pseudonocardia sp. N23]GAY10122.1 hypothetical protein TOK_4478 [Pseudonocardia sp. N23]
MADKPTPATTRRFPDLFALVVGLLSLGVAGAALTGHDPLQTGFDFRWVLAGAAVLLGLLMLVGSLRRGNQ